jgi:hypothetical protein
VDSGHDLSRLVEQGPERLADGAADQLGETIRPDRVLAGQPAVQGERGDLGRGRLGGAGERGAHVGVDEAGEHDRHRRPAVAQFLAQVEGEHQARGLAGAVDRGTAGQGYRADRQDEDDAGSGAAQAGPERAGQAQRAEEVHLHDLPERGVGNVAQQGPLAGDAGVADEQVDVGMLAGHRGDLVPVSDIEPGRHDAGRALEGGQRRGVARGGDDGRRVPVQRRADEGGADPAVGPGDQYLASAQIHGGRLVRWISGTGRSGLQARPGCSRGRR